MLHKSNRNCNGSQTFVSFAARVRDKGKYRVLPKARPFCKKGNAQLVLTKKFIYILGPTGFDSEISWNVSMPSAGVQLVNIILHTFNWRK